MRTTICLLALLPLMAWSQDATTTPAPLTECINAKSMTFVPLQLNGTWFEVARNPAPPNHALCTQVVLDLDTQDNVFQISTTFSDTPLFGWVNATMRANVSVADPTNIYGYNFTYVLGIQSEPQLTYKLLDTDYTNYALICGYELTNDVPTSVFNIILTRNRMVNSTDLSTYEGYGAKYTGCNETMVKITQDASCYTFGGSSGLAPCFFLFVALLFALFLERENVL